MLIAFAAAFGALGGAYLQGRHDGSNAVEATAAREERVGQLAGAAAAASAAEAISKIKVRNTTIQNEVQREVSERVVYRDCVHSPDQLQRINAALTGAEPPADHGQLPAANASR
jgi:hypothetical protein